MFKKIKDCVKQVQSKPWAEPVGKALGVTAKIVDCVGDFVPGVGFLGGALQLGSELLNSEPSMSDLKAELSDIKSDLQNDRELSARTRKLLEKEKFELEMAINNLDINQGEMRTNVTEIKNDVQTGFRMMAGDLKAIEKDVSAIKDKLSATYDIVCDLHYRTGIDRIEATYDSFITSSGDVSKWFVRFQGFAQELQTEYYQHMKTAKLTKFLKIVHEKDGVDACKALYQYILIVKCKYLQMTTVYYIYNNEHDLVAKEFDKFNNDFYEFERNFGEIMADNKFTGNTSKKCSEKEKNVLKNKEKGDDAVDCRPLPHLADIVLGWVGWSNKCVEKDKNVLKNDEKLDDEVDCRTLKKHPLAHPLRTRPAWMAWFDLLVNTSVTDETEFSKGRLEFGFSEKCFPESVKDYFILDDKDETLENFRLGKNDGCLVIRGVRPDKLDALMPPPWDYTETLALLAKTGNGKYGFVSGAGWREVQHIGNTYNSKKHPLAHPLRTRPAWMVWFDLLVNTSVTDEVEFSNGRLEFGFSENKFPEHVKDYFVLYDDAQGETLENFRLGKNDGCMRIWGLRQNMLESLMPPPWDYTDALALLAKIWNDKSGYVSNAGWREVLPEE